MADRLSKQAWERQRLKAKEEIRLMKQLGLELVEASAKADMFVDSLYEGLFGEEAPGLTEVAS